MIMERTLRLQGISLANSVFNYALLQFPSSVVSFTVYCVDCVVSVHSAPNQSHDDFLGHLSYLFALLPVDGYSVKTLEHDGFFSCNITIPLGH